MTYERMHNMTVEYLNKPHKFKEWIFNVEVLYDKYRKQETYQNKY